MYETILYSTDSHLRTQVNKALDKPCKYIYKGDLLIQYLLNLKNNNILLILDYKPKENAFDILVNSLTSSKIKIIQVYKNLDKPIYVINEKLVLISSLISTSILQKAISFLFLIDKKPIILEEDSALVDSLFIGDSPCIKKIKNKILSIYDNTDKIVILGESGVGKEIIVKLFHKLKNKDKKIININCSFLDDNLIQSKLFGHKKGSFTGADCDHLGYIEAGEDSTIFFDEIENLSSQAQSHLLRFLEDNKYSRLGESFEREANSLLLFASNIGLSDLLKKNILRNDFYMRIAQEVILIPPLRERIEDIPLLIHHFEKVYNCKNFISNYDLFISYSWPGNVRQLFNVLARVHRENPGNPIVKKHHFINY